MTLTDAVPRASSSTPTQPPPLVGQLAVETTSAEAGAARAAARGRPLAEAAAVGKRLAFAPGYGHALPPSFFLSPPPTPHGTLSSRHITQSTSEVLFAALTIVLSQG